MSRKPPKIDTYTKEELLQIVHESYSYADCLRKMGYTSSGRAVRMIKSRFELLLIDTSHFKLKTKSTPRTFDNVFCENSTCNQSTLRRFYKNTDNEYICSICGQEPFWEGKPLTLILDHINGNNHDNRLENLRWVCPNCNMQLETTNRKKSKPPQDEHFCKLCGKPLSCHSSTYCKNCLNKLQGIKGAKFIQDKYKINRTILKDLIRKESFTKIGKKFGVSDNAVRKWCKRFNLPTSTRKIKQYTDEEWENI